MGDRDRAETGALAVPLQVTAELANGFVAADPWSPALDGVMVWARLYEELGEALYDLDPHRDGLREVPLPLLRVGEGVDWYYACSSPFHASVEHVSFFHRRFDDHLERLLTPGKRAKINTASGRYKSYRLPAVQRVTPRVMWFAVGAEAGVRRLLEGITHLGKKRNHGHGQVLRWTVRAADTAAEAADWREHALRRRPRPVSACQPEPDDLVMDWGIRPPIWFPENRRRCVMPWGG